MNLDFENFSESELENKTEKYERIGNVCAIQLIIFLSLLSLIFFIKNIIFLKSICKKEETKNEEQ
jgi:uncharacterized membrane protein